MISLLIFDWGGTVMADTGDRGPMYLWKEVAWVPGAQEALEQVKGKTCCIATNAGISDGEAVLKALKRVGADIYFDYVFTSRDLGFAKPDPGFFGAICDRTGSRPEECVMIGNSYVKDICGAKEAGMHTVFFNASGAEGSFPKADAVITNMIQLPFILSSWRS